MIFIEFEARIYISVGGVLKGFVPPGTNFRGMLICGL